MDDLRYPIGKFRAPSATEPAQRDEWIAQIASTPAELKSAVEELSAEQLDTSYRPEGWTVRQVVHHVADSHVNAYCRFRIALTEDEPTVRPYEEARWAELSDAHDGPVETSLELLAALHSRWTALLRSLDEDAMARRFQHPKIGTLRVAQLLSLYAWHGRHHTAHVTALTSREGW